MAENKDQNKQPEAINGSVDTNIGASVENGDSDVSAEELLTGTETIGDVGQNNSDDAQAIFNRSAAAALAIESAVNSKGRNRVAWFALLLVMLVAAAVGYLGWKILQQQEQIRAVTSITQIQHQQSLDANDAINHIANNLKNELERRDQKITALESTVAEVNTVSEGISRRLLSLTATTTNDWRLAEVEYLLRLANQRILISKDASTALDLLAASDHILLELADPRVFSLRQVIADDRAAIAMVAKQDLDGTFLKLSALARQIDTLPIMNRPVFKTEKKSATVLAPDKKTSSTIGLKLSSIAQSTWLELKSLVVIQALDTQLKPLLPPPQQEYLRSNLRLLMSQAQLALLDGRQQVYSDSLTNVFKWLGEYFPQQEHAIQVMINEVERLASLPVSTKYPNVSASLIAIKAFIAEQHKAVPALPEKKIDKEAAL